MPDKIVLIIAIYLSLYSCTFKNVKKDMNDDKIVLKLIEQTSLADSNLAILDFKLGSFEQDMHNDTLLLIFNGFIFGHVLNPNDSIRFKEISDSTEISAYQEYWSINKIGKVPVVKLDTGDFIIIDSIQSAIDSLSQKIYQFNWSKIEDDIQGFISYSKPIFNDYGNGVIGQVIYKRDYMDMMVYRFEKANINTFELTYCIRFQPLGYELEFLDNKLYRILPYRVVIKEFCKNYWLQHGVNTQVAN